MALEQAITVRNARKRYGSGPPIFDGLNLNVSRGCIYGLLGASGCGKTTLLSCVVGTKKLDSGDVWVLGGKPGTKGSGIPGPCVGYMPQDVSLVDEFTVIGALYFFGRINGLDNTAIEERYLYLKDLLQLPARTQLIKNMSGGQQRRVSFAAALIHKPQLLILDEPTVGLDPVLRDNIWNHLVKIAQEESVTVVITTHYIEEARQADKIGLLRMGQLLAESSPNDLLAEWQTDSLEEAFLNLSQRQVQNSHGDVNQVSNATAEINEIITDSTSSRYATKGYSYLRSSRTKRCQALLIKNVLQFIRHPGGVLFSIILPILQVVLFFNTIGPDPKDLSISVVNHDAGNCDYGSNRGVVLYDENERTCHFEDISCRFLNGINDTDITKLYYDNYAEAERNVASENSVGIIYFRRNFSSSMVEKLENFFSASNETILSSQIEIALHTPDKQIVWYVQKLLYKNFYENYEKIVTECGISPKYANIPMRFEKPIFGTMDQRYDSFVMPAYLLTTLFILATSACSGIIITDRNSGVWDRCLVQGVTTSEILITHLISQVSVIVIQVTVSLCMCFLHFDLECKGSLTLVIWLTLLAAICGMSYGFLISVMCNSHSLVNYTSVGSFYPLILISGLIWPIQGMPKALRWFALCLPLTIPNISLRGVLEKGSSFDEPEVYTGFCVVLTWIVGFISICLLQMRAKTS